MNSENILCGRKLEFGDITQIEYLKLINEQIDRFLAYTNAECENYTNINDCEICSCKCYAFQDIQEEINFYKTKGV